MHSKGKKKCANVYIRLEMPHYNNNNNNKKTHPTIKMNSNTKDRITNAGLKEWTSTDNPAEQLWTQAQTSLYTYRINALK